MSRHAISLSLRLTPYLTSVKILLWLLRGSTIERGKERDGQVIDQLACSNQLKKDVNGQVIDQLARSNQLDKDAIGQVIDQLARLNQLDKDVKGQVIDQLVSSFKPTQ